MVLLQSAHGHSISMHSILFPTSKHIGSAVWALKVSHPKEARDVKLFSVLDLLADWMCRSGSQSIITPRLYKRIFISIRKHLITLVCSLYFTMDVFSYYDIRLAWSQRNHKTVTSCFTGWKSYKDSMGMAVLSCMYYGEDGDEEWEPFS